MRMSAISPSSTTYELHTFCDVRFDLRYGKPNCTQVKFHVLKARSMKMSSGMLHRAESCAEIMGLPGLLRRASFHPSRWKQYVSPKCWYWAKMTQGKTTRTVTTTTTPPWKLQIPQISFVFSILNFMYRNTFWALSQVSMLASHDHYCV
jgi:hypothetical protein